MRIEYGHERRHVAEFDMGKIDTIDLGLLLKGDHTALRRFADEHGDCILRAIKRVIHNEQDAEDCYWILMNKASKWLASYDNRLPLHSWLYGVGRLAALNHLRTTRPNSNEVPIHLLSNELSSRAPSPEEELLSKEFTEIVLDLIKSSNDNRNVLAVCYRDVYGLAYEEVAILLNVTRESARTKVSRGRAILIAKMLEKYPELL